MTALQYDIDALEAQTGNAAQLLYALWEVLTTHPKQQLTHEEKITLWAWEFDSTHGNGIRDQVVNEGYEAIANGLIALKELGDERLEAFGQAIKSVFAEFDLKCGSVEEIAELEALPDERRNRFEERLDEIEEPFNQEIWEDELILNAAYQYVQKHQNVFRARS